jgi:altronate dehydratase large subunit
LLESAAYLTGVGTLLLVFGNPLILVIKITGNKQTYENMFDNMNLDISAVVSGEKSINENGEMILQELIDVCNGKFTNEESYGFGELAIYGGEEVWCPCPL